MKKIKYVILIVLLLLDFVLQCEIFHNELWNFNTADYLASEVSTDNEEQRIQLLNNLYQTAQKENVEVFTTKIVRFNQFQYQLHIYGNNITKDVILKTSGIMEKHYKSLLSGNTEVIFHDFTELTDYENRYITQISFIGDEENIYCVYNELHKNYDISFPQICNSTEMDMITSTWGTIAALLIILTCIEVIYRKKEIVVRISLGEDVKLIICKSIVQEIVTDIIIFAITKTCVFHFISGEYMKNTVFAIYGIGIILSCICYCSYAIYDIKKAFSNANDSKAILNITYIVKILVTAISIFAITTNLNILIRDTLLLSNSSNVDEFKNYSFLSVRDFDTQTVGKDYLEQCIQDIFKKYYKSAKPAICQAILEDSERNIDYVYVNEYAASTLNTFTSDLEFDSNADIIYFIPERYNNEETLQDAEDCLKEMYINIENMNIQTVFYSSDKTIKDISYNATIGTTTLLNPVIIFSQYDGANNTDNLYLSCDYHNVMFDLSDKEVTQIIKDYHLEENGYELTKTGVTESYEYYNNILRKTIGFYSSFCFFTLILQAILLITINRMEYQINATELALKKVLGYNIWQKNRKVLFSSIIFNIIIIISLVITGHLMNIYSAKICISIGLGIMVMEIIVIMVNIFVIEKKNIQKILKGGCL